MKNRLIAIVETMRLSLVVFWRAVKTARRDHVSYYKAVMHNFDLVERKNGWTYDQFAQQRVVEEAERLLNE